MSDLDSATSIQGSRGAPDTGATVGHPTATVGVMPNRKLTLTPASKIRLRRPAWLWNTAPAGGAPQDAEGRIPVGALTITAGQAGIGKSQFTCWLAAGITRGTVPGEHHGRPRSVIIAANEDSWEMTIAPRLSAAGADLNRVFRVEVADDGSPHSRLTLPADSRQLERLIPANDVALLICDPLLSALGDEVNDYRGKEVRAALEPLVAMADRVRCTVVGLAHFNKSAPSGDPLLAIQGAAAFGQLVRAALGCARDDDGEGDEQADKAETFVLSTTKNNLGRDNLPSLRYRIIPAAVDTDDGTAWVSRFEFTGEHSPRSVRDIMRDAQTTGNRDDADDRGEAVEFIRTFLVAAGGSAPSREVLKAGRAAGLNDNVLKKARRRAGVRTQKQSFGEGWEWTIDAGDSPRCREDSEGATHADVAPSAPSVGSGMHSTSEALAPSRDCGHPGDPTRRCGTCIAQQVARRSPDCRVCGLPADLGNTAGLCGADDADHRMGWRTAQTGQPWPGDAA